MDLYIKVFGRVSCRDIEIFKCRRRGMTFSELAKMFNLSRQRCEQIYSKIKWKIKLFIILLETDIEKSTKKFIEEYNQSVQPTQKERK